MRIFVDPSGGLFNSGTAGVGGSWLGNAEAAFVFRTPGATLTFVTRARLTSSGVGDFTYTLVDNIIYTGGLGGMWDVSVPITFDLAFTMDATLVTTASALAGSNSTASSWADFGNSIYWAGITSITLADGSVVTEFSALGSTGHDWKASAVPATVPVPEPIPEPATILLLAAGLAGLGIWGRKRMVR
jgi:hypothetical protein